MVKYPKITDEKFREIISSKLEFKNFYNTEGLYPHQEFVRRFLAPWTPYRGLLLFHSLGSGKSIGCISVAIDHYIFCKRKCIVVTRGDSGANNFAIEVKKYLHTLASTNQLYEFPKNIFEYKRYMALSHKIDAMSDEELIDTFEDKIIILDEAHNIRDMKEQGVFFCFSRIAKLTNKTKIILATGTPMTDDVWQIVPLLNILLPVELQLKEPNSLIKDYHLKGIISYNTHIVQKPRVKYHGKYLMGDSLSTMVSPLGIFQENYYDIEQKKQVHDIYRGLSQISLFVFPNGYYGKKITKELMLKTKQNTNILSPSGIVKTITYYKYSLTDSNLYEYLTGDLLRSCSSKYYKFLEIIQTNKRYPIFVFVEEVRGSGLLLLGLILEQLGYKLYNGESLDTLEPEKRYTYCVGSLDISPNNSDRLEGFNSAMNCSGKYVQILLGSRVIGESITLKNVKQFHSMTPHWNDSTIDQAIGRVVRSGSHDELPPEERYVDIYIHAAIFKDRPEDSIDIIKLGTCIGKQMRIRIMENRLENLSVDSLVFGSDDNTDSDISTFLIYYVDKYLPSIRNILKQLFRTNDTLTLSEVAKLSNIHPDIITEVFRKIITSNDMELKPNKYTRISEDRIYFVDSLILPFEYFVSNVTWGEDHIDVPIRNINHKNLSNIPNSTFLESTKYIRNIQTIREKISYLESAILSHREDLIDPLYLLWQKHKNKYYHIMCYREEEVAYRASKLIPKHLEKKTRVFEKGTWKYVESVEVEQVIMEYFRQTFVYVSDDISRYNLFGFISTLDNNMRIMVKQLRRGRLNDRRMDRRGRSLLSLKKLELVILASSLISDFPDLSEKYFPKNFSDNQSQFDHLTDMISSQQDIINNYSEIISLQWNTVSNICYMLEYMNSKRLTDIIDKILIEKKLYIMI